LIASRQPVVVKIDACDWEERIAVLRSWIEEQRVVVAALRAAGQSTKRAELLLQELQRCRDAIRQATRER
jgi:hypothetical protein